MFIENNYARPLFDFEKGGPPKAFQCLLSKHDISKNLEKRKEDLSKPGGVSYPCGKITRTERGMRMHLKTVHNWKEQPCLYSTEQPTAHGSAESRKRLRAGPPQFPKESQPSLTETTQASPRLPGMNES